MTMQVEKLNATFGARVTGVALGSISDTGFDQIYDLWLEHALLVFPAQHLKKEEQEAFAHRFGELEFEATLLGDITH